MNTIELTEEEYKAMLDAVHYLIDEFYEEEEIEIFQAIKRKLYDSQLKAIQNQWAYLPLECLLSLAYWSLRGRTICYELRNRIIYPNQIQQQPNNRYRNEYYYTC